LRASEVAPDEAPDVFGEGHAQVAGTLARTALEFGSIMICVRDIMMSPS